MLKQLFATFLREKEYLSGVSLKTIKYLGWVFNRWQTIVGEMPRKDNSKQFVMHLVESGISPFTINPHIRGMNSFLTWLAENEHSELIRIKKIKQGERRLKTLTDQELKRILSFRPKTIPDHRLYSFTDAVKFNVVYRFVNRLPIHHLIGFILVIEFIACVKTTYFIGWIYIENYNVSIEIQYTFFRF